MIIHGADDEIVPLAVAESYVARHRATRLVALPGIAHFAVIDPVSEAWPTVVAELESLG